MDEVIGLPDGDKAADIAPLFGYPHLFTFGLFLEILELETGGIDPVKGVAAAFKNSRASCGMSCSSMSRIMMPSRIKPMFIEAAALRQVNRCK